MDCSIGFARSFVRSFNRWRWRRSFDSPAVVFVFFSLVVVVVAVDVRNMCILQKEKFHCSPALPPSLTDLAIPAAAQADAAENRNSSSVPSLPSLLLPILQQIKDK